MARRVIELEPIMRGGLEIPQDSLDELKMRGAWIMHEETSLLHRIGNVKTSQGKIPEGAC